MRRLVGERERDWDDLVASLPRGHLLQTAAWADLKSRWGWSVHRFAWGPPGAETAVAQILVRRLAGGALQLGYVPRGPILRQFASPQEWCVVLSDVASWARRSGLAVIKIDPGLPRPHLDVIERWRALGWRPVVKEVQFPNTMTSDLALEDDQLLAAMKSKTRYNIRLARRHGVVVRQGSSRDFDTFYSLYSSTASRGGFAIRTAAYYEDAWSTLLGTGRAVLLLAEHEGRVLAGSLPVAFGDTAWFLFGASGEVGRRHMPSHLIQWESMRWARSVGCRTYDWWGAPTRLDESDPMWGVYVFKRGFGARLAEQHGAWETPGRTGRYLVLRTAEGARGRWLALRSWARSRGGSRPAAL